jgi:vitamin K-dependent gamma-carboxylase
MLNGIGPAINLPHSPTPISMSEIHRNTAPDGLSTIQAALFKPVDIASLAVFRFSFGAILLWEVWRYFDYGWIERYYIEPEFHFTYYGFEWVRTWSGDGMFLHFGLLAVLAAGILLGLFYRVCTALFLVGFTYVFLLEQARYLNHFYAVCLLCLILVFVPAHRAWSLDASRKRGLHTETVPAWTLWLLRAQIGIIYFHGGLAKLNTDWLRGEPLSIWLADRADFPVVGPLLQGNAAAWFFSYGGLLFDLLVVPALLLRATRPIALIVAVLFHVTNNQLFQIGIFPWMMIAGTLLFLPPDWPRRLLRGFESRNEKNTESTANYSPRRKKLTVTLLGCFLAFQLLFPLRHFLYPGVVHWTEEGHRFSWHMKLRDKFAESRFFGHNPTTGKVWEYDTSRYLTLRQYEKMSARPDMLLQFAHILSDEYRERHGVPIEVRAEVWASLNGRIPQLLIDPEVNLACVERTLRPASWIMPLTPSPPGEWFPYAPSLTEEDLVR